MVLRYRGVRHRPKGRSEGRNLRGRTRTRPRLAHAYPSSARRRQARPDLRRGRASPANGSRGPNRAATARPVARTSGLALRVFRSPFAGSSPLWLRDGVGGPTIGRIARRGAPAPRCGAYSEANPLTRPNLRKDDPPDGLDRAMSRRFYGEVPPATLGGSGQVKGRSLKGLRVREQRLLQRRRPPRSPGRVPLEPQGL
jgi:hypothetical protein